MSRRARSEQAFSLFAFQDIITSVTGIMLLVTMLLAVELLERSEDSPREHTAELSAELAALVAANEQEIERLRRQLEQRQGALAEIAEFNLDGVARQSAALDEAVRRLDAEIAELQQRVDEQMQRLEQLRRREQTIAVDDQATERLVQQFRDASDELRRLRESQRVFYNPAQRPQKSAWLIEVSGNELLAAQVGRSGPAQRFAEAGQFVGWAATCDASRESFVLLVKPDGVETYRQVFPALHEAGFDLGFDLLTAGQTAIDPQTGAAPP